MRHYPIDKTTKFIQNQYGDLIAVPISAEITHDGKVLIEKNGKIIDISEEISL